MIIRNIPFLRSAAETGSGSAEAAALTGKVDGSNPDETAAKLAAAKPPAPTKKAKPKLMKVRVLAPLAEEIDGEVIRFEPLTEGKPTVISLPEDRVAALGSLVAPI